MSASAVTCSGHDDFRERDYEIGRERAARFLHERRDEDVQRADGALAQLFRQGLDANAYEGREGRVLYPFGTSVAARAA